MECLSLEDAQIVKCMVLEACSIYFRSDQWGNEVSLQGDLEDICANGIRKTDCPKWDMYESGQNNTFHI